MESRTKHRILGVFIIIGLVIILLPFFQSNKELKTETAMIKTPPFPDQNIEVSETENVPPVMNKMNVSKSTENEINSQSKDILSVARPNVVNRKLVKELNSPLKPIIKTAKADVLAKKSVNLSKSSLDDKEAVKLKSAVWVIQIGSFKNKTNALRLVNQLRANGYRAFIQQTRTATLGKKGENTRVYVGPEHKKAEARALAFRLQSEMHIQGIVISYKPLTL